MQTTNRPTADGRRWMAGVREEYACACSEASSSLPQRTFTLACEGRFRDRGFQAPFPPAVAHRLLLSEVMRSRGREGGGREGGREGSPSCGLEASSGYIHPSTHPLTHPSISGVYLVWLHAQHELVSRVDAHHPVVRLRLKAHLLRTVTAWVHGLQPGCMGLHACGLKSTRKGG